MIKIRFLWGPLNGTDMEMMRDKPPPVITVSDRMGIYWYMAEMYDEIEERWIYTLEREKKL